MCALRLIACVGIVIGLAGRSTAAELPKVVKVELQPLAAQVHRLVEALDHLGAPLPEADKQALQRASHDKVRGVETIQAVLDPHCLAGVRIEASNKLETQPGSAKPELAEQGWCVFLVKLYNTPGLANVELEADSPNAQPMQRRSTSAQAPKVVSAGEVGKRFLDLMMYGNQPLVRNLSGLELEYRILQIYCRDAGRKEALLGFSLWRDAPGKKPARQRIPSRCRSRHVRLHLHRGHAG
jgi:hypothetical protein